MSRADVDALEDAVAASVAQNAGLPAALGPAAWAEFDAFMREALAGVAEDVGLAARPVLVASTTGMPQPLTAAGDVAGLSLGLAVGLFTSGIADLGREGLSTGDSPITETREITEGGTRMVGNVSGGIDVRQEGSTVVAEVDISLEVQSFDAATGAARGTSTFRSTGTISVDMCPDANGVVRGRSSLSVQAGGPGASAISTASAEIVGQVGDDANLQSYEQTGDATDTTTGADGTVRDTSVHTEGDATLGRPGDIGSIRVGRDTGAVTRDTAGADQAALDAMVRRIGTVAGAALSTILSIAQERWRDGACVGMRATEQSRDVRPNEQVQFEAQPFHKIEQRDLAKPVMAAFTGKASADPVDVALPAPLLVSFKAGPQRGDVGTVTLTSTSNRGIGTLDLTFRVREAGWFIDHPSGGGRITGQKCGDPEGEWVANGTYEVMGMEGKQRWVITIDAGGRSGTYAYSQTSKGRPGGAPVTVTVKGKAKGTVTLDIGADGRATMHLVETDSRYTATTDAGGLGASVPGGPPTTGTLIWEVGGSCP